MKLSKSAAKNTLSLCPCESGKAYSACCGLYHAGLTNHVFAPSAEALMRSRYSAYAFALDDYFLKTWHPTTRPASLNLAEDIATKWLGLQIQRAENSDANNAIVEFVARYKICGKAERLHEVSRFQKIDQQWFYLDGQFPNSHTV